MSAQQPSRIDENAILFAAIDSIIPNPRQPRRIFRDDDPRLLELSASIKEHGLLQPLVVTRLDDGGAALILPAPSLASSEDDWFSAGPGTESAPIVAYQIIAGERRWRASKLAGLLEVAVVIKEATP